MGPNGHAFTPERTKSAERAAAAQLQAAMAGKALLTGPVGFAVEFFCQTRRRTDLDNLVKLVSDAANGIVFEDDSQIEEIVARLTRGVGKKDARTEVTVYKLDPG